MSGFTTTGSSILTDIEALPKSVLFWRSLTHWIGGIGIIVLVIVVMPTLQIGGYHLFTLESSLQEKIQPRIKSVGNRLLFIYVVLTGSEIILLLLGNMSLFDSVCHAFGTVATGGFSPKNTSIANYSPYIQYVVMIFMLLAGTNFVIHYYIIKRQFAKARNNEELKIYYFIVFSLGILIAAALYFIMGKPLEESFRESFFQVISIITCTGFASADYLLWPTFAWILIFFAMFLGGSTGSTAGGIKMARHLILFKNIRRIFNQMLHPKAILTIRLNKNTLSEELNSSILTFVLLYLIIFMVGSVIMLALGIDAKTATSSVATCMAGIGPGIGSVGPTGNFAHLPEIAKLLLTFLMLVGRLELYTVIMLFTRTFWSK
jgi:trk system potassium uptake protein TrkH